jgi:hypothetical protein
LVLVRLMFEKRGGKIRDLWRLEGVPVLQIRGLDAFLIARRAIRNRAETRKKAKGRRMRSKGVRELGALEAGMGVSIFTKPIIHDDYQFVKV